MFLTATGRTPKKDGEAPPSPAPMAPTSPAAGSPTTLASPSATTSLAEQERRRIEDSPSTPDPQKLAKQPSSTSLRRGSSSARLQRGSSSAGLKRDSASASPPTSPMGSPTMVKRETSSARLQRGSSSAGLKRDSASASPPTSTSSSKRSVESPSSSATTGVKRPTAVMRRQQTVASFRRDGSGRSPLGSRSPAPLSPLPHSMDSLQKKPDDRREQLASSNPKKEVASPVKQFDERRRTSTKDEESRLPRRELELQSPSHSEGMKFYLISLYHDSPGLIHPSCTHSDTS
eukprot:TRINITY_DN1627_c0_g1_i5.p1 TRINITY_DN1627_c0_g1~~TRINITY_DN1627_c0_g1_i5.p1  ORF type:complete len:289 (+),score=73.04 TRINITY_DN1627_c0_g1_i5:156-1022(+)